MHRDIKPENVLLKDRHSFVIKVADFGCSKLLERGAEQFGALDECTDEGQMLMRTYCGTKAFAAPEILRHEPYGATCDADPPAPSHSRGGETRGTFSLLRVYMYQVYSTGVLLALLLTGKHPLEDVVVDTNMALASRDVAHVIEFDSPEWRFVSPEAVAVVKLLAHTEPTRRPTPAQVLTQVEWISQLETVAAATPLAPAVVRGLRDVRVDQLQSLALRLVVADEAQHATNHKKTATTTRATRPGDTSPDSPELEDFFARADGLFLKLDADHTGLVRRSELHAAAQGTGLAREELDMAFDNADLDGTGAVSRDELRASLLALNSALVASHDTHDTHTCRVPPATLSFRERERERDLSVREPIVGSRFFPFFFLEQESTTHAIIFN